MLILASASPRRKELMEKLHLPFVCEPAADPERIPDGLSADRVPEYLAAHKAEEVFQKHMKKQDSPASAKGTAAGHKTPDTVKIKKIPDTKKNNTALQERLLVIGSDTIVLCDGRILGKPHSRQEAKEMLRLLSGRTHEVLTGVCLRSEEKTVSFTARTEVAFYPLSDAEIEAYVASGEPMDKAGAYGIQGGGALLVKGIRGDYYTVMGFPIAEIARRLQGF